MYTPIISPKSVCCVFHCYYKETYRNKDRIKLYNFPRKGTLVDGEDFFFKWIEAVKLPRKFTREMKVCSRHFREEDFSVSDGYSELKPSAIPSQHLPSVWRNKFYSREYGRLIKLLEFRGIGRLRLCFEAKLGRRIRKAEKRAKIRARKRAILLEQRRNDKFNKDTTDLIKVSAAFSLASESGEKDADKIQTSTHEDLADCLTSEIVIKEEPISDPEDGEIEILNNVDTVEEMLARMNEDSNENTLCNYDGRLQTEINEPYDAENTICQYCGDDDCLGHADGFQCYPCNKVFKSARQLNAHYFSHFEYTDSDKRICNVCNQVIRADVTMEDHMDLAHSPKSHVCMLCDKSFRFKSSLMEHVSSHAMIMSYICKICQRYFESPEKLDDHVKTHRAIKRAYTCRQCGQKFTSKYSCWSHLNSHMRARSRIGLSCQVCGRVLSTKATLKEHMFIHSGEKPFECQLCGRKIRHKANFIIHVQGHSLGQPHVCTTCGMGFAKKGELNSHIAAEHPEDRPYHCIICGLRFRTESRFLKHAVSHDAYLEEIE